MQELDIVVLLQDLPDQHLLKGDVGTIVHVHNAGSAFEVEFATFGGDTIGVVTLANDAVRPVDAREIAHVRAVA